MLTNNSVCRHHLQLTTVLFSCCSRRGDALVLPWFVTSSILDLEGSENHVWSLAYHLIRLGHKVIVITHAYKCPDNEYSYGDDDDTTIRQKSKRSGVRYLPGGIKVYYCPFLPMVDEDCLPTFTVTFPLLRWIFIREAIDVVHSHQATSTLANEAVTYAAELGLASVYTDHSLFGF